MLMKKILKIERIQRNFLHDLEKREEKEIFFSSLENREEKEKLFLQFLKIERKTRHEN